VSNCKRIIINLIFFCLLSITSEAQDRFTILEQQLQQLSINVPELKNRPQITISDVSLNGFLKSLAQTNQLNFNIDNSLQQKVVATYSNETIINILLELARQHNLGFRFTGSIISIFPYIDPLANLPPPAKNLLITFNPDSQVLTLDLNDDSLLNVAKKITQLTNKNIVVLPELFGKKVNGYIQNLPISNALEKISITNGFKLNKTNDDVFVLEALAPNEQLIPKQLGVPNANYNVRKVNNSTNGTSSSVINVSETGNLLNINITNTPLSEAIRNIADQVGVNYFIYSELTGSRTAKIENMVFNDAIGFLLRGTNYTYRIENGIYMIGNRQDEGLRSHKLIQLKYRSVDSLLQMIPPDLKKGIEIKEFDEYNSFLISGSQPQIIELENFIRELDKIVPVVMIEFIIMDIQKRRTTATGLKIGVSDSIAQKTGGTLFGGTDFTFSSGDINRFIGQIGLNNIFNIGRVTPSFYVNLKALETNGDIEIRQTPKLSTLNGHEASYNTGIERYYRNETENIGGAISPIRTITRQFEPVDAKLSIKVRPFVSGDEQVTLNIVIENSDFIGELRPDEPPPKATSGFNSSIRVKNEEMILLGGIERIENSENSSGTPILSRIPIIKWLFSSKSKIKGKIVSIVFIKPTIIY
jgi:type IV pilus assembly protein PilQ